ncbi:hypothetical protein [Salinispora mooreana]|uniref:hypothetical protein n=1 Tax=Salinispora mooreana TaxID=999545 RepID=UPI000382AD8D|nr:hypothetical protein [Salinispora mooreana]
MILRREPVLVQATVVAVMNLIVAFDVVSVTPNQSNALIALSAAVLGLITRQYVTPVPRPGVQSNRSP